MTDAVDQAPRSGDVTPPIGGANRGTISILAELRGQMETLYALRDVTIPSLGVAQSGQPFTVALPADPDGPLDQFALQRGSVVDQVPGALPRDAAAEQAHVAVAAGIHMPYWGLLWASGQALAETVLAERKLFCGRRVLEMGCGLGLTAAAALAAGASLWAVDCFAEALLFTSFNGLQTTGRIPQTRLLDWRSPLGREACRALGPFDIVLAADVLYEEEDVEPLLGLVPTLLLPDGAFWLAEPGRRVSRKFLKAAQDRGWQDSERSFLRSWPPDGEVVQVWIHRLTTPV
ncbi:MAG: class I SAM-dependent methyltransferase [Ktedonobacterales bacterium]